MRLWPLFADDLADLLAAKLLDEPGRHQKAHQHGRDRGHDRAEGRVAKDVERAGPTELVTQRIEELVDHDFLDLATSPCTTRSARTPREALTKTTSRGPGIAHEPGHGRVRVQREAGDACAFEGLEQPARFAAQRDHGGNAEIEQGFPGFAVQARRLVAELAHLAEHEQELPRASARDLVRGRHRAAQARGIGVVGVVEHEHARVELDRGEPPGLERAETLERRFERRGRQDRLRHGLGGRNRRRNRVSAGTTDERDLQRKRSAGGAFEHQPRALHRTLVARNDAVVGAVAEAIARAPLRRTLGEPAAHPLVVGVADAHGARDRARRTGWPPPPRSARIEPSPSLCSMPINVSTPASGRASSVSAATSPGALVPISTTA